MTVECDGSELVVRFSPFLPHRLTENAEDTYFDDQKHGRSPRYGVSVIAGRCQPGETVTQAVARICSASTMTGGKKVAVATGTALRDAGFELVADPTTKEPLHHLVGTGPLATRPDTSRMAEVLSCRLDNPNWRT